MPPLLRVMTECAPMPLTVRPSKPPFTLIPPVAVLATAGLRIHTPPSVLLTTKNGGLVAPVLLDSTIFI